MFAFRQDSLSDRGFCLGAVSINRKLIAKSNMRGITRCVILPTSIQSGGWILHFRLCFKNIATHRGTSVGKDALNGPMSPCQHMKSYYYNFYGWLASLQSSLRLE